MDNASTTILIGIGRIAEASLRSTIEAVLDLYNFDSNIALLGLFEIVVRVIYLEKIRASVYFGIPVQVSWSNEVEVELRRPVELEGVPTLSVKEMN